MQDLRTDSLLDLSRTLAAPLLSRFTFPWEALPSLKDFVAELGKTLDPAVYKSPSPGVWIAASASVAPSATINPPAIIGERTEVRPGAFIRGSVIIGSDCVIGNSCEFKNCVIFDSVQVPHFNYVGDSILGFRSHMGAGSVTSNVKSDKTLVTIKNGDMRIETGMKKLGAILGDRVEIGCNSVLNPGTVIGRDSRVYPLSSVRGVIPERHIFKSTDGVVPQK